MNEATCSVCRASCPDQGRTLVLGAVPFKTLVRYCDGCWAAGFQALSGVIHEALGRRWVWGRSGSIDEGRETTASEIP